MNGQQCSTIHAIAANVSCINCDDVIHISLRKLEEGQLHIHLSRCKTSAEV
jgi:hypothetical protein